MIKFMLVIDGNPIRSIDLLEFTRDFQPTMAVDPDCKFFSSSLNVRISAPLFYPLQESHPTMSLWSCFWFFLLNLELWSAPEAREFFSKILHFDWEMRSAIVGWFFEFASKLHLIDSSWTCPAMASAVVAWTVLMKNCPLRVSNPGFCSWRKR